MIDQVTQVTDVRRIGVSSVIPVRGDCSDVYGAAAATENSVLVNGVC